MRLSDPTGTERHDRFMLPHAIWRDFQDIVRDLRASGLPLDAAWYRPFLEKPTTSRATSGDRRARARTVLPDARRRNMGVIGMKVYAAGELLEPRGPCSPADALGYVLSLEGVSCAVVGCRTPGEVDANADAARRFRSFSEGRSRDLEERTRPKQAVYTSYKKAP